MFADIDSTQLSNYSWSDTKDIRPGVGVDQWVDITVDEWYADVSGFSSLDARFIIQGNKVVGDTSLPAINPAADIHIRLPRNPEIIVTTIRAKTDNTHLGIGVHLRLADTALVYSPAYPVGTAKVPDSPWWPEAVAVQVLRFASNGAPTEYLLNIWVSDTNPWLAAQAIVKTTKTWSSDTVYTAWNNTPRYIIGDSFTGSAVLPTTPNGFLYICTTSGTSHATIEPIWPTVVGDTVNDNGVIWECQYNIDYQSISQTLEIIDTGTTIRATFGGLITVDGVMSGTNAEGYFGRKCIGLSCYDNSGAAEYGPIEVY